MYTICKSQKVANTMLIQILPLPFMAMNLLRRYTLSLTMVSSYSSPIVRWRARSHHYGIICRHIL